jgi:hypothetical protein
MGREVSNDPEYLKSKFRCPLCGKLAGCTEDGKIGMFSTLLFARHLSECRKKNAGKSGKTRYDRDED